MNVSLWTTAALDWAESSPNLHRASVTSEGLKPTPTIRTRLPPSLGPLRGKIETTAGKQARLA
jgi:hypothetical protein